MGLKGLAQVDRNLPGEWDSRNGQFFHHVAGAVEGNVVLIVIPAIAAEAIAAEVGEITFNW